MPVRRNRVPLRCCNKAAAVPLRISLHYFLKRACAPQHSARGFLRNEQQINIREHLFYNLARFVLAPERRPVINVERNHRACRLKALNHFKRRFAQRL